MVFLLTCSSRVFFTFWNRFFYGPVGAGFFYWLVGTGFFINLLVQVYFFLLTCWSRFFFGAGQNTFQCYNLKSRMWEIQGSDFHLLWIISFRSMTLLGWHSSSWHSSKFSAQFFFHKKVLSVNNFDTFNTLTFDTFGTFDTFHTFHTQIPSSLPCSPLLLHRSLLRSLRYQVTISPQWTWWPGPSNCYFVILAADIDIQ